MQARKQCYSSVPTNRNYNHQAEKQYIDSFEGKQYLLNTLKILKGNKKKTKQHLRTQMLKQKYCGETNRLKSAKGFRRSTVQTIDNTPRNYFEVTDQIIDTQRFNTEKQLLDFIHERRKASSRQSKDRLKLFNQPSSKAKINKVIFSKNHRIGSVSPAPSNFSQNPQLSFRQALFSKQLKKEIQRQNHKMKTQQHNIEGQNIFTQNQSFKSTTNIYKSQNLDKRMNQYMNVLIKKTRKDQIDLLKYISKRHQQSNMSQSEQVVNKSVVHNQLSNTFDRKCLYLRNRKTLLHKRQRNLDNSTNQKIQTEISNPLNKTCKIKNLKQTLNDMLKQCSHSQLVKKMITSTNIVDSTNKKLK